MPTDTPSLNFNAAASYLSKASSLSKVSSSVKLELYGLFKYVTVSASPNTSRPSIFDMTGRAKWDAWNMAGKTYQEGADAENRYVALARNLGWDGTSESEPGREEVDLDNLSDEDTAFPESSPGGGGLGGTVSSMASLQEEVDLSTLHGLALSNDEPKLESFLHDHPDIDVNGINEHGYTALHLAADRGYTTLVEILLRKGADPFIKDSDSFTASELARIAGHCDVVIILDKLPNEQGFQRR